MFRPYTPKYPCNDWVSEADRRGIALSCKSGGQDIADGRPTQRWDATTPAAGQCALWYDPEVNFIVKVLRTSKSGAQSGYELQNVKQEIQPPALFESGTSSIASKKSALEFDSAWLRARNFRISWLSLPASKEISDLPFPCARNDFALPPTQLLSGLFS
jgi:hypothetical protein